MTFCVLVIGDAKMGNKKKILGLLSLKETDIFLNLIHKPISIIQCRNLMPIFIFPPTLLRQLKTSK